MENLGGSSVSWERAAASPSCAAFLEISSYFNCAYFGLLLFNRAGEREDLQGNPAGTSFQMTMEVWIVPVNSRELHLLHQDDSRPNFQIAPEIFNNINYKSWILQLTANRKAAIWLWKPKGYPQMSAGPRRAAFASSRRVSQINAVTQTQELCEHVELSHWASFAETSFFQTHPKPQHSTWF